MKIVSIYRHIDGTARGIVWQGDKPTEEEINPEGAVYINYPLMPNEFCDYVQTQTKEKVHELLDKYIWR